MFVCQEPFTCYTVPNLGKGTDQGPDLCGPIHGPENVAPPQWWWMFWGCWELKFFSPVRLPVLHMLISQCHSLREGGDHVNPQQCLSSSITNSWLAHQMVTSSWTLPPSLLPSPWGGHALCSLQLTLLFLLPLHLTPLSLFQSLPPFRALPSPLPRFLETERDVEGGLGLPVALPLSPTLPQLRPPPSSPPIPHVLPESWQCCLAGCGPLFPGSLISFSLLDLSGSSHPPPLRATPPVRDTSHFHPGLSQVLDGLRVCAPLPPRVPAPPGVRPPPSLARAPSWVLLAAVALLSAPALAGSRTAPGCALHVDAA